MKNNILAHKLDMTQIFLEDGTVVPVTQLQLEQEDVALAAGDIVDVIGNSKGKGFAGVVKRYSFAGGPKTHGQSDRHRAPGSIGSGTFPARVWKGQKMAGRMGGKRVTVKNLEIVQVENNIVAIKGAIPGPRHNSVHIKVVSSNAPQETGEESNED